MPNLLLVPIFCYFISWLPIIAVSDSTNGVKFCGEDDCELNKTCKYQFTEASPRCVGYKRITDGEEIKAAIVDKINLRRNKVASGAIRSMPPASNMRKLVWSEELSASAQVWADHCHPHSVPDHLDTCRDRDGVAVGQTVGSVVGESPGLTAPALVDVWFTELLSCNASVLQQYLPSVESSSPHYDYFTQLAWADTYEVGCGGVKFLDTSDRNRTIHRLVCNFMGAGNIVGDAVYDPGRPCSRCAGQGRCDAQYTALCAADANRKEMSSTTDNTIEATTENKVSESVAIEPETVSTQSTTDHTESINDDILTMFDYFSHFHDFTKQAITFRTTRTKPCKDVLAVDNLLELLKKKISTDPYFKDMLTTGKSNESHYSDAGVSAFVDHVYSKKTTVATTSTNDNTYFNSTLLADLVEAVMFRGGEKYSATEALGQWTRDTSEVSPIKIQAELARVAINNDFTGHYFFPEDNEEEEQSASETTESYYDASIPVSEVILELDDIRRNSGTRDFVDEILDSETVSESTKMSSVLLPDKMVVFKSGHNNMRKFLEEIGETNDKIIPVKDFAARIPPEEGTKKTNRRKRQEDFHKCSYDCSRKYFRNPAKMSGRGTKVETFGIIYYKGLLQKLAEDLKILKFNERFHCSQSNVVMIDIALVVSIPSSVIIKHLYF